jgi:hypothetical protein
MRKQALKTSLTEPALPRGSRRVAAVPNNTARSKRNLRIGLFGIGLDTYWPQFTGLKRRLEGYLSIVHRRLSGTALR